MNAAKERVGAARYLREQARRYERILRQVPREEWPHSIAALEEEDYPTEVWRSNRFLVLVYGSPGSSAERLSVLRTELALNGRFAEGISWDDLQELKAQCGRGGRWACELFPPDDEVVNVQNMRHLWLLPEAPPFAWRVPDRAQEGNAR